MNVFTKDLVCVGVASIIINRVPYYYKRAPHHKYPPFSHVNHAILN